MGGVNSYSTTAASNTTLGGITLADTLVPSNLDNAFRAAMADIRKALNDIGGKAVSSGTDTITLATDSTVTSYFDGLCLAFIAGGANTGAATLNVDSVGAKAILKAGGTALAANDIVAGMVVLVYYDESANTAAGAWMLANPSLSGLQAASSVLTALTTAFVPASSSAPASLAFAEDTDNGSHKITLKAPAAITADVDLTLPDGAGTVARTEDFLGQQTIWVPAGAMTPRTTNGAAAGSLETSTNDVMAKYLAYDSSTSEGAQFAIQMPKGWNEGTIIAQFVWTHPSTTTNFGVKWGIRAVALANSDPLDTAFGTEQEVADTGGTTNDVFISDETSALTVAGSPGAEELVIFEVYRDPADASDTMAVDAYLLGVKLHYTIDSAKDD